MDPVTASLYLGGLSSATTIGSAFLQDSFSQSASKKAYKYWKWGQEIGPQLRMRGLRKAGLNPILAAGGSSAGAAAFGGGLTARGLAANNLANSVSSAASLSLARKQGRLLDAQTDKERSMQSMYGNLSNAAHWDALNKSYETFKNSLTTKAYETKIGGKALPVLRALNESGVGLRDVVRLGSGSLSSAGAILNLIKTQRKIGF